MQSLVREILGEILSKAHTRIVLVSKIIDALESDAAWVEMYGITGELLVPSTRDDGEHAELLQEARKV